jgi:hypothetical protein
MSEHDLPMPMKPCLHCGHKAPTVAAIAGKPPRGSGGGADADRTYFGLCVNPACFARGPEAGSREEAARRWNERAEDKDKSPSDEPMYVSAVEITPAPSPWHDAAETPEPCKLCVVEMRDMNMSMSTLDYFVAYYDSVLKAWRDCVDAEEIMGRDLLRWLYLDTSDASR